MGHLFACSRSLKSSLAFYKRAYALAPHNPLITLCNGVTVLQYAFHKKCLDRHHAILQAMAYFDEYAHQYGITTNQVQYNLGRAFHQLGLVHLAIPHYERLLASTDTTYRHETAYNLHLIYMNSNRQLARFILFQYNTI
jgi:general transcription factor 3C polypeptide 3 (transcription factor C subunit 4)